MSGFFFDMGRKAGRALRQGNWLLQSLTGTDADAIAAEEALGRDLAGEVIRSRSPADPPVDRDRQEAVSALAARLAGHLTDQRRRWRVRLVAGGEPNAFALPGGFLFLEDSLLDLCGDDPAEVGFVIGHEIGHVLRGHALQRTLGDRGLAKLAGALPIGGIPGMVLRQAALSFLSSAYSREQEFEADDVGARLIAAAGLDPLGGARLLSRLRAIHDAEPDLPLLAYFASHPPLAERVARLRGTTAHA
jgi:Zn-dependent protease with chaperone function